MCIPGGLDLHGLVEEVEPWIEVRDIGDANNQDDSRAFSWQDVSLKSHNAQNGRGLIRRALHSHHTKAQQHSNNSLRASIDIDPPQQRNRHKPQTPIRQSRDNTMHCGGVLHDGLSPAVPVGAVDLLPEVRQRVALDQEDDEEGDRDGADDGEVGPDDPAVDTRVGQTQEEHAD